ncbi:hypothetical protein DYQ86_25695 [Acidobacteria bacterium AB60]|nr:hypothetical protein DYQ86_25695 [Acidobacteria bacterium AB60]
MKRSIKIVTGIAAALWLAGPIGCHSYHVDMTVENRTGGPIRLLEVDYPSASFGADSLDAGAVMHYRIQLSANGTLKVQYTTPDNHQVQIQGPAVTQGQEGKLAIILQPSGKADFNPELKPISIPQSGKGPEQ